MDNSSLNLLPPEIREQIYGVILHPESVPYGEFGLRIRYDLSLFYLCRQIYYEARRVFYRDNFFVRIGTPWHEAVKNISQEGQVPIVSSGEKSKSLKHLHLEVVIDAPHALELPTEEGTDVIIRVQDLPLFCKMWQYSDLTYPILNSHLRLTLHIRNPNRIDSVEPIHPIALQKKLLEPFSVVRNLESFHITGEWCPSIEKFVRDGMEAPILSPQDCLEQATKLKDDGNIALQKRDYKEAIRLYCKSFGAIHIICKGRFRHAWADAYYQVDVEGGKFDGQNAQFVRMILRIKLVANMVMAYLKMEDYDEAIFWGTRTINLLKRAMIFPGDDEEDFMQSFPAPVELGKIYYRTGVAYKHQGDKLEARRLLRIAAKYLPHDSIVKSELASVAPRLG